MNPKLDFIELFLLAEFTLGFGLKCISCFVGEEGLLYYMYHGFVKSKLIVIIDFKSVLSH